jgi:hypothetical protein
MELITLLIEHPFVLFMLLVGAGGLLTHLQNQRQLKLAHAQRMAEIEARKETARALAAAPEEAQRNELAKQLLEAYGEAGEGLKNDEKGSLVRWELSKSDD